MTLFTEEQPAKKKTSKRRIFCAGSWLDNEQAKTLLFIKSYEPMSVPAHAIPFSMRSAWNSLSRRGFVIGSRRVRLLTKGRRWLHFFTERCVRRRIEEVSQQRLELRAG